MKQTIKQYLTHLVKTMNGEAKRERISKLQQEIEEHTTQAELNKLDDSYTYRINHVHALQYRHMQETGKYHPFGVYTKIRSRE